LEQILPHPHALSGLQTDVRWVPGAVLRLAQFLDRKHGRYRFCHAKLPELITAPETWQAYSDRYLDPRAWHRKIAGCYGDNRAGAWS
jgi:hypothetical protein